MIYFVALKCGLDLNLIKLILRMIELSLLQLAKDLRTCDQTSQDLKI